ncbi:hypothetical protein BO70DRAFT_400540 [Aspergillus heteromorphus CBS 117.55]|uniref:Mating locus protein n=1 Tax=Aspergillus heteromorphus CBS 117.55 TaxID=1448321 RepID=A0A317V0K4_9EURO|nr:uncharacterized protein BO70DRAFT_400540 [Aspergillus heteromorphus CBS 117.55]PWY67506.1 hypothetical protein BO70DRAFT_400540 [Aspergillus heteromorphus CBS 117.55]
MDAIVALAAVTEILLRTLDGIAGDAGKAPELREKAMYVSAAFRKHRNVTRLMAQVTALNRDEELIHPSHRIHGATEAAETRVGRYGNFLQAIMTDHNIKPSVADIEGHPIQLINSLDPEIEHVLKDNDLFRFHQALLRAEKKANDDLAKATKDFGYHWVFRVGLKEYYLTKTIVEKVNFIRPDYRGDAYRAHTQACCYDVMERRVRLNDAEKQLIVRLMGCQPADAHRFWAWLERHRVGYRAMKACIALLNNLQWIRILRDALRNGVRLLDKRDNGVAHLAAYYYTASCQEDTRSDASSDVYDLQPSELFSRCFLSSELVWDTGTAGAYRQWLRISSVPVFSGAVPVPLLTYNGTFYRPLVPQP